MILEYSSWQVNGLKRIWDESSPLMQTGADLSSAQLSAKDLWCCDSFQWRLFPFMSFFYICELLLPGTLNTLNLPNHRNVCSICCNSTPHHPHLNDLFSEVKHARLGLLLKIGRLTASFSAEIQVYITPSDGNGIKLEKKNSKLLMETNTTWKPFGKTPLQHNTHLPWLAVGKLTAWPLALQWRSAASCCDSCWLAQKAWTKPGAGTSVASNLKATWLAETWETWETTGFSNFLPLSKSRVASVASNEVRQCLFWNLFNQSVFQFSCCDPLYRQRSYCQSLEFSGNLDKSKFKAWSNTLCSQFPRPQQSPLRMLSLSANFCRRSHRWQGSHSTESLAVLSLAALLSLAGCGCVAVWLCWAWRLWEVAPSEYLPCVSRL